MNNKKIHTDNMLPKDSDHQPSKKKAPEDEKKAVVKPKDKVYREKEASIKNPAKTREQSEQPVHPVKRPPAEE